MARKRKTTKSKIQLVDSIPSRTRGSKFEPFFAVAIEHPKKFVKVPTRIGDRTLKANGCKLFVRKGEFFIQAA